MSGATPAGGPPPAAIMSQMLGGFQVSQALYVVTKLDICTLLDDGPLSVSELARRSGALPRPLGRLIRTLATIGVFHTSGAASDPTVATTPLGATLSRRHPETMANVAEMWMETHYQPFSELLHTVRTGEPAAIRWFGKPPFEWIAEKPERAEQLGRAMADLTGSLRRGLFDGYALPPGRRVADIGGAEGSVLASLIDQDPDREGILFDLPSMRERGIKAVTARGLAGRIRVVSGDFFEIVPTADVYVLSYILHDWDDESCVRLLRSLRRAAAPGARLLVIEGVVPPGDEPHLTKMVDLTMLGMTPGLERTATEYHALLSAAGFTIDRIVATPTAFSILEAGVTQN